MKINVWDDINVQFDVTILPYENNKYGYVFSFEDENGYKEGEGEIYSINSLHPLEIVNRITTSVREQLTKET